MKINLKLLSLCLSFSSLVLSSPGKAQNSPDLQCLAQCENFCSNFIQSVHTLENFASNNPNCSSTVVGNFLNALHQSIATPFANLCENSANIRFYNCRSLCTASTTMRKAAPPKASSAKRKETEEKENVSRGKSRSS